MWNDNSRWMYLFHCTCLPIAAVNVTSVICLHLSTVFSWARESKKKGPPRHWHQWHFSASWQVLTRMVAAALKIGLFAPVFFLRENNPVTLDRAQVTAGVAACPSCRHGWWTRRTACEVLKAVTLKRCSGHLNLRLFTDFIFFKLFSRLSFDV